MKTKIKRHYRSVISVLLSVCMLISCMTVGLIATDAAKVADDSTVGDGTYYLITKYNDNNITTGTSAKSSSGWTWTLKASDFGQTSFENNKNYYVAFSSSSSYTNIWNGSTAASIGTTDSGITSAYPQEYSQYRFAVFTPNSGVTSVTVKVSGTAPYTYSFSTTSSGSTPSGSWYVGGTSLFTKSGSGTSWDDSSKAVQMTLSDGYYTWTGAVPSDTADCKFRIMNSEGSYHPTTTNMDDAKGLKPTPGTWYATQSESEHADGKDNYFCLETSDFKGKNVIIKWDATNKKCCVVPATSTVTTAVSPAGVGTALIEGVTSKSGIAYESELLIVAAATNADYHFHRWEKHDNLKFADLTQDNTTVKVLGDATATAVFKKNMFDVTCSSAANGVISTAAAQYEWGTENIPIVVRPAQGYRLSSLTAVDSDSNPVTITDNKIAEMPKKDVTVTAVFEQVPEHKVTYSVEGSGYVSVGYQYDGKDNEISQSIESGAEDVPEGSVVNFCAIPQPGSYFTGWYNASNTKVSDDSDYPVTIGASDVSLTAKFSDYDYKPETGKIKILIPKSLYSSNKYLYVFEKNNATNNTKIHADYSNLTECSYNSTYYYVYTFSESNNTEYVCIVHKGVDASNNYDWDTQTKDLDNIKKDNTYIISWNGKGKGKSSGDDAASLGTLTLPTEVRPVVINVTNPLHGETGVKAYAAKDAEVTVTAEPDEHYTAALTENGTDITASKKFTMPNGRSATVVVTYTEDAKYTVTFGVDANGGGTVSATAGGKPIESGASVYAGTKVVITAEPNSGYHFKQWGASDTTNPKTINSLAANTTATATFEENEYKLVVKGNSSNTETKMKELENGVFVSASKVASAGYFSLFRNLDNKYVDSNAGSDSYYINSGDLEKHYKPSWTLNSISTQVDFYKNNTGKAVYVLYNPKTDEMWVSEQKDGAYAVEVYLKDGTIRANDVSARTGDFGETTLLAAGADGSNTSSGVVADTSYTSHSGYVTKVSLTAAQVRAGAKIHFKTVVANNYKAYYVKGFDINGGPSAALISQQFEKSGAESAKSDDYPDYDKIHGTDDTNPYNEYTLEISLSSDPVIEVTPIYFKRAANKSDNVRFYAYDFTGKVKEKWGGFLAVYPYIEGGYNPFSDYPGQLMVNEGGKYYADIPTTDDNGVLIQGLTMNNYIFDDLHAELFYPGVTDKNSKQYQTYDYNEFQIINSILVSKNMKEDIIFDFKYKDEVDVDKSNLSNYIYYRDYEGYTDQTKDDPTKWQAKDYRKTFNTIDPDDAVYQFESLDDAYGNRVDILGHQIEEGSAKSNYNPILIVSNGYDYSAVGKYATAWVYYRPENWTGDPGAYTLFEVMGGQGNTTNKFQSESYLINPKYSEAIDRKYTNKTAPAEVLDCQGIPAMITYEYEGYQAKSNLGTESESQSAHRSDGRWYYSDSKQNLKAHVIVEYAEKTNGTFVRDYFQDDDHDYTSGELYDKTDNTTVTKGFKAYFTNEESTADGGAVDNTYGYTEANAVADGDHYYDLEAITDTAGEYKFEGWYTYNGTDYTLLSREDTISYEAKNNELYVARFVKVPAGTLTVSHNVKSTSTGRAKCYNKVEVLAASDSASATYTFDETTSSIKVGTNFIKSDSTQWLRITLRTEPSYSTFNDFEYYANSAYTALTNAYKLGMTNCSMTVDKTNCTAVILVKISDLFSVHVQGEDPEQDIKSLPFYSVLTEDDYLYTVKYYYTSRLWGGQTYVANGKFTDEELDRYIDIDNGSPVLKDDQDLRTEFLRLKAPYEDNFMDEISWNTLPYDKTTNLKGVKYPSRSGNNVISIEVHSTQGSEATCSAEFHVPFKWKVVDNNTFAPKTVNEDGTVNYAANVDPYCANTTFKSVYAVNDNMTPGESTYVTAPKCLRIDENTVKYFSYWKVTTTEDTSKTIMYCYYPEFNLAFYQDYVITAIYNNNTYVSPIDMMFNNQSVDTNDKIKIRFIENSRNQWNNGGGNLTSDPTYSAWNSFGDRIFCDFVVDFNFDNTLIRSYPVESEMKTGIVIERVTQLEDKTVDETLVKNTDLSTEGPYNEIMTDDNQGSTEVQTYVSTNFASKSGKALLNSPITYTQIDNKNRIHHFYGFSNIYMPDQASELRGKPTTLKNYLYRAYGYVSYYNTRTVQDTNGDGTPKVNENGDPVYKVEKYGELQTIVSEHPVYFTFYDMASIENDLSKPTT